MLDLVRNPKDQFSHDAAHSLLGATGSSCPTEGSGGDQGEILSTRRP